MNYKYNKSRLSNIDDITFKMHLLIQLIGLSMLICSSLQVCHIFFTFIYIRLQRWKYINSHFLSFCVWLNKFNNTLYLVAFFKPENVRFQRFEIKCDWLLRCTCTAVVVLAQSWNLLIFYYKIYVSNNNSFCSYSKKWKEEPETIPTLLSKCLTKISVFLMEKCLLYLLLIQATYT